MWESFFETFTLALCESTMKHDPLLTTGGVSFADDSGSEQVQNQNSSISISCGSCWLAVRPHTARYDSNITISTPTMTDVDGRVGRVGYDGCSACCVPFTR